MDNVDLQVMRQLLAWQQAGHPAQVDVVPGTDHFTVLEELVREGSPLQRRVVALVDGLAGV